MTQKRRIDIFDLFRVIAMFLILNSHCKFLYPSVLQDFASGGAVGNALFFTLSGYFFRVEDRKSFFRKLLKLYIPVWVVSLAIVLFRRNIDFSVLSIFRTFCFPTFFWFIGALVVYKTAVYYASYKAVPIEIFGCSVLLYFLFYFIFVYQDVYALDVTNLLTVNGIFHAIYFFPCFTIGYYLAKNRTDEGLRAPVFLLLMIAGPAVFLLFKWMTLTDIVPMPLQIFAPFGLLIFSYAVIHFGLEMNQKYCVAVSRRFRYIVSKVSECSLECYLIQFSVIRLLSGQHLAFPFSVLSIWAIVLFASVWLHYLLKGIISRIPYFKGDNFEYLSSVSAS